jgi:CheY-like chemotaxis protein
VIPVPVLPIEVLLVEDDPGDELMTREAFEENKVRNNLHVARDGEQALDFLYRRGEHAEAPSGAEEDILRSYQLHANAYVTKPVDFARFIQVVRQIDDFFVSVVRLPARDAVS